jgi:hypothetical protein
LGWNDLIGVNVGVGQSDYAGGEGCKLSHKVFPIYDFRLGLRPAKTASS